MRLSTTTYDFVRYCPDRRIAAPIPFFVGTGFRRLDLSFYDVIYKDSPWLASGDGWKREVEEAAAEVERLGAVFTQAHAPDGEHFRPGEERDALLLATERSIEACGLLGIPQTVVHAAQLPVGTPTEFLRANINFYAQFMDAAERSRVDLLTENSAEQNCPGYYLRTGRELREFIELAGFSRLHACWDTGHANMRGNDQHRDLLDLGDELRGVHIQDNCGDTDAHVCPMVGTTNFDEILRGLLEIGYAGDFTFEGSNTLRPANCWPHSRRNVQPGDRLASPPVRIQQQQIAVMYEIGRWMLESYGVCGEEQ